MPKCADEHWITCARFSPLGVYFERANEIRGARSGGGYQEKIEFNRCLTSFSGLHSGVLEGDGGIVFERSNALLGNGSAPPEATTSDGTSIQSQEELHNPIDRKSVV